MPYTINFTDETNNDPIIVQDGVLNTETSLSFPGQGSPYGAAVAENFLHLLENFASPTEPARPIDGQLWYDTTPGVNQLKIYDGTGWVAAGGLKKAESAPEASDSLIGDLWVDTDNQQLYLFSGSGWVLVGPQFSDGLSTGATPTKILGTDNQEYTAIIIEVAAQPVAVIANDSFTPKTVIPGFTVVQPGITLSTNNIAGDGAPKYYGTAEKAENLIVNNASINAANFLRGDITSTTQFPLNIQNNQGINYGINGELNIGVEGSAGVIQHQIEGSSIDVRVRNDAISKTVIRVDSNLRVGINNEAPDEALDVAGNIKTNGQINITSVTQSDSFDTGSLITKGGAGISKNLNVGGNALVQGLLTTQNISPAQNNTYVLGTPTNKYSNIYSTTFTGNLTGNVSGTVSGRAGSADKLTSATTFRLTGDVTAQDFVFDGQQGGNTKTFSTTISNEIIAGKPPVSESQTDDEIIINRVTGQTGLYKISRRNLLQAVATNPPGVILPFAGNDAPPGWLICDGTEYRISEYQALFDAIGYNWKGASTVQTGFFAVPDFRGRVPLGKDNMGSRGSANRVTDESADRVGSSGGRQDQDILIENLPQHKHDMQAPNGDQYYALRNITGSNTGDGVEEFDGAFDPNSSVQGLINSGGIQGLDNNDFRTVEVSDGEFIEDPSGNPALLGQALNVMNPYATVTYIIYTGRSA